MGVTIVQRYELASSVFLADHEEQEAIARIYAGQEHYQRKSGPLADQHFFCETMIEVPHQYVHAPQHRRCLTIDTGGAIRFVDWHQGALTAAGIQDGLIRTWKTLEAIAHAMDDDLAGAATGIQLLGDEKDVCATYHALIENVGELNAAVRQAVPASGLDLDAGEKCLQPQQITTGGHACAIVPAHYDGAFTAAQRRKTR